MKKNQILWVWVVLIVSTLACSKEQATPNSTVYFPQVKSIIKDNCLSCHSASGSWAGRPTAFDSDASIADLYASIKASVADPVTPRNKRMPQGGSLSATDIDIIVKWFDKGGKVTD
jgi:uncharacterized membrane protein